NWSAVPPPRPFGRRRRLRKEDPLARSNVRRNAQGNRPTCPRQNADAGSVGQDAADGRERLPCPKAKAAGFLLPFAPVRWAHESLQRLSQSASTADTIRSYFASQGIDGAGPR